MKTLLKKKNGNRKAGILLPIFSLPSKEGIGTLGKEAYRFVDWLKKSKMKIWQVLPLLPTNYGNSPYQSCASDALNFYFIDFEMLALEKLLEKSEYENLDWGDNSRVDYGKLFAWKTDVLKIAFSRFNKDTGGWKSFLTEGKYYDFAVFMAIKTKFEYRPWTEWEAPYRDRDEKVLSAFEKEHKTEIEFWQFTQYIFLKQWNRLKEYANTRGVSIMGDMPIYVAFDSVETWKYRRELFMVNDEGNPSLRAGVPPDAFSEDGQLWGNPVYDWGKLKESNYKWWKNRIEYAFTLFDIVRIDHFRAFDRFYTVAEGSETAKLGEWRKGPGAELFVGFEEKAIVAEDLGDLRPEVITLRDYYNFKGMRVVQFTFDSKFMPEDPENLIIYTGTHDNQTIRGWVAEQPEKEKVKIRKYFKKNNYRYPVLSENFIAYAMDSKAEYAIVPRCDVLNLTAAARLNTPGTVGYPNWAWRMTGFGKFEDKISFLKKCVRNSKR